MEWLAEIGSMFRPYQYQTALAIIATLLVLFGNDINGAIKHMFRKQHFVLRTLAFVVVCAFGYGLATVWLTGLLAVQLGKVPNAYIVPLVVFIFFSLGAYAQKHRQI